MNFLIIAYRGASAVEPENTLRAVRRALEDGAHMVEIDVRQTRDGHTVVIHDERVDRTTDGRGYVRDMTLEELKRLNAGKGERIPTLEEVIGVVKGKMKLVIDLKEEGIEDKVIRILEKHGIEEDVIILSPKSVAERIREQNPRVKAGVPFSGPPQDLIESSFKYNIDILRAVYIDYKLVTADFIEEAHSRGLSVITGKTSHPKELEKLIKMKVDGIITDNPAVLSRVLHKLGFDI